MLKYRKQLKDSEIPKSIVNLINNKYGTLEIDQSKYVEESGKIIYILRIKKSRENTYVTFSPDGIILEIK